MNWILKTFWELLLLGFSLPSLFKWFWPKESYKICQNQIHFWLHNWLESKNYWLTQSTTNSIMPQGTDPWNYNFTSLFWGITRCLVLGVFPLAAAALYTQLSYITVPIRVYFSLFPFVLTGSFLRGDLFLTCCFCTQFPTVADIQ